jgi:hypothetical protein
MLNEDERSGSLNWDDGRLHSLFLAFLQQVSHGRGPHRRAALAMRYSSARAARDFGKSAAENSHQGVPEFVYFLTENAKNTPKILTFK